MTKVEILEKHLHDNTVECSSDYMLALMEAIVAGDIHTIEVGGNTYEVHADVLETK